MSARTEGLRIEVGLSRAWVQFSGTSVEFHAEGIAPGKRFASFVRGGLGEW